MSKPFRFGEWTRYIVPDANYKEWRPDRRESDKFWQPIQGKSVYLFQALGSNVTWFGEYFVDTQNLTFPVDMEKAHGKERDARPKFADKSVDVRVPYEVNGYPALYYGVVSRIRLPLSTIEQLQMRIEDLLPVMDVAPEGKNGLILVPELKSRMLRVVDPITIGIGMNRQYQRALDDGLAFGTLYEGQSEPQRELVIKRQAMKMLSELLTAVLDQDPDDNLGLRGKFKSRGETGMRYYAKDYDAHVEQRKTEAARRAASLCYWLEGELMQIVQTSYQIFETTDFSKYIEFYGEMVDRLAESTPGSAFLDNVIENKKHFAHKYMLRTSPPDKDVWEVGRKAASGIFNVWKELASRHFDHRRRPRKLSVIMESMNHISGFRMVGIEPENPKTIRVIRGKELAEVDVKSRTVTLSLDPNAWAKWVQDGHAIEDLRGSMWVAVEIFNFAWTLDEVLKADREDLTWVDVAGTVGSLADAVDSAAALLGEIAEKSLAKIGLLSAVIDAVCGFADAGEAAQRNDYSAMAGYGLVGTGSAILAVGSILVMVGAAKSVTILGAPAGFVCMVFGSILLAAGWVIAVFTADSDIQLFVSHCYWGEDYGKGSERTKWGMVAFSDWEGNPAVQITALYNILAGFSVRVTGHNFTEVLVSAGTLHRDSKVYVNYEVLYPLGVVHQPKLMVDFQTKKMKQLDDGHAADLSKVTVGERSVTIDCRFPPNAVPKASGKKGGRPETIIQQVQYARCEVYVDLYGDGKHRIPGSGAWIKHLIYDLRNVPHLNWDVTTSKDF
jgi:hypothetical protein